MRGLEREDAMRGWFVGLLALLLLPVPASAQDYPNRPIKVVVGFPPGGGYGGVCVAVWVLHESIRHDSNRQSIS
jgi:tripartite-type tricarboxylate transporter receptor subunit TctC